MNRTSGWSGSRRASTAAHKRWRQAVPARAGFVCEIRGARCTRIATEADHVIPVARGGTDDLSNGQAACVICHAEKSKAEAAEGRRRANALRPKARRPAEPHPGLTA